MAVNFQNNIDLNKLQLLNFAVQRLSTDPSAPVQGQLYFNTTIERLKLYTGGSWLIIDASSGSSTTIDDIVAGNNINVSITSGIATISHADTSTVTNPTLTGANVLATLTFDGDGHVTAATTRALTLADLGYTGATDADKFGSFSIAGTSGTAQTIGSGQTATLEAGSGISTTAAATRKVTVAVDATVVRTTGAQTIGGVKTFSDNMIVNGDLTVSGTTTTVNSETVTIADNIIVLNSNATGTPTEDAGIEIERGTSSNVQLIWNETADVWETVSTKLKVGDLPTNNTPTTIVVADANNVLNEITPTNLMTLLGAGTLSSFIISDGTASSTIDDADTITFTSSNSNLEIQALDTTTTNPKVKFSLLDASTTVKGVIEIATNAESITGSDAVRAITPASLEARLFKASIGDGTATQYTVTHNFNTRDVQVEIYDNATYQTVYAKVVRTSVDAVQVSFGVAPTTNQYRVLIRK